MKKKYKSTWLLFGFILCFEFVILTFLTGCNQKNPNQTGNADNIVVTVNDSHLTSNHYFYMIDKESDVVYLCYRGTYGIGITPRLHSDGTPYTATEMNLLIE